MHKDESFHIGCEIISLLEKAEDYFYESKRGETLKFFTNYKESFQKIIAEYKHKLEIANSRNNDLNSKNLGLSNENTEYKHKLKAADPKINDLNSKKFWII